MIVPSLLGADFSCLKEEIKKIEKIKEIKWIHLDVMDGSFVPNISFGSDLIKSIRKNTKLFFDVHLMIKNPEKHLESFKKAGANLITIQIESCNHLHKIIYKIKNLGCKVGIALNPATSLETIKWIIKDIDLILLMSVNPGFGGQKFIKETIFKIIDLKKYIKIKETKTLIQVDGGICSENISLIKKSGADIFVVGTYLFNSNIEKAFKNLNNKIK